MLTIKSIERQLKMDRIYGTGDQRGIPISSKNIPDDFRVTPRAKEDVPAVKTTAKSVPAMRVLKKPRTKK